MCRGSALKQFAAKQDDAAVESVGTDRPGAARRIGCSHALRVCRGWACCGPRPESSIHHRNQPPGANLLAFVLDGFDSADPRAYANTNAPAAHAAEGGNAGQALST